MASIKLTLVVLCFAVAVALVRANPLARENDRHREDVPNDLLPMGEDGSLFLAGQGCGKDEQLMPGALPTCEPTCRNPRPACAKVFFSSIDFVPCFCKKPLVRNEKTKECIEVSKCPN